jgi:tyrosyl-tRNA synthetase
MVNNADWLDQLNYIPFLRDYRRALHHQPHADLRQREAAPRPRAAADLPRIQLHDPAGLRLPGAVRRHGCVLQMGGSDQWGNIVNGIELAAAATSAALRR